MLSKIWMSVKPGACDNCSRGGKRRRTERRRRGGRWGGGDGFGLIIGGSTCL